jgi:hypothetical protein
MKVVSLLTIAFSMKSLVEIVDSDHTRFYSLSLRVYAPCTHVDWWLCILFVFFFGGGVFGAVHIFSK